MNGEIYGLESGRLEMTRVLPGSKLRSRATDLTRYTFKNILTRLSRAGFKRDFVQAAILPDWWDEECATDPDLLPEIEVRVARFLGCSVRDIRDPRTPLVFPSYAAAQLRRVRDIDRDRLGPAIHSALRIASAVVRSLREPTPAYRDLPRSGLDWRAGIERSGNTVGLRDVLADLWGRGIPVVPLDWMPAPSFQGLAGIVEGRPVIVLGHRNDEPGRVAFVVAHEAGHIAARDCAPGQPVVDEEESVSDDGEMEQRADRYAMHALIGADDVPRIDGGDFRALARNAYALERETGADASVMVYAWGRRTGDYQTVALALRALYRAAGARRMLRELFDAHVDLDAAAESDRLLLRCVYGDSAYDAVAG